MQVDIVSGALASAHTPLVLLCAGLWLRESRPKGVLVSVQLFYLAPKALKAHSMTTKHLPPLRSCSQSKAGEANPVTQTTANCHLLGNMTRILPLCSLETLLECWLSVQYRCCLQLLQQLSASQPTLGRPLLLACALSHPCLTL